MPTPLLERTSYSSNDVGAIAVDVVYRVPLTGRGHWRQQRLALPAASYTKETHPMASSALPFHSCDTSSLPEGQLYTAHHNGHPVLVQIVDGYHIADDYACVRVVFGQDSGARRGHVGMARLARLTPCTRS